MVYVFFLSPICQHTLFIATCVPLAKNSFAMSDRLQYVRQTPALPQLLPPYIRRTRALFFVCNVHTLTIAQKRAGTLWPIVFFLPRKTCAEQGAADSVVRQNKESNVPQYTLLYTAGKESADLRTLIVRNRTICGTIQPTNLGCGPLVCVIVSEYSLDRYSRAKAS